MTVATSTDIPSSLPEARPPEWLVPPEAVAEWSALSSALADMQPEVPMCSTDPEAWWGQPGSRRTAEAIEWCRACPVAAACLAYAVAAREPGIWGGTTAADRGTARRGRKARP